MTIKIFVEVEDTDRGLLLITEGRKPSLCPGLGGWKQLSNDVRGNWCTYVKGEEGSHLLENMRGGDPYFSHMGFIEIRPDSSAFPA